VDSSTKAEQNSGKGETKDLREANDNVRKAQDDEATGTPVDPQKTGNKPRFDRDR
jgi:hypothetical protein